MRAAWLWAWADIRGRWASLLLLAAIVALLAVGAVLAVAGGGAAGWNCLRPLGGGDRNPGRAHQQRS